MTLYHHYNEYAVCTWYLPTLKVGTIYNGAEKILVHLSFSKKVLCFISVSQLFTLFFWRFFNSFLNSTIFEKGTKLRTNNPFFFSRSNQFRCTSGHCIDRKLVCNGRRDCDDGTDETIKNCETNKYDVNQIIYYFS